MEWLWEYFLQSLSTDHSSFRVIWSGALFGKMLLVRIVENNRIYDYYKETLCMKLINKYNIENYLDLYYLIFKFW